MEFLQKFKKFSKTFQLNFEQILRNLYENFDKYLTKLSENIFKKFRGFRKFSKILENYRQIF